MKNKKIIFIFTIILVFLFKLNSVYADKFEARFFPGKGGYLKYNSVDFLDTYQEAREIDTEIETQLTNYYVRDGYTFAGWVAERDNGAVWYCKDKDGNRYEKNHCDSLDEYNIYSSTNKKKYQTGANGQKVGYHAVWKNKNTGELEFPDEIKENSFKYYDVQYLDVDGKYIGGQSMIIDQDNKIMIYENEKSDQWNAGVTAKYDTNSGLTTSEHIEWWCNDDVKSSNCRVKKIFKLNSKLNCNNGDKVYFQVYKENYKPQYYILYLLRQKNINDSGELFEGLIYDRSLVKAEYDIDFQLNSKIFEGKIIDKWLIYSYELVNQTYKRVCYNPDIEEGEDFSEHFSEDNCNDIEKIKVESGYAINIPYDSKFLTTRRFNFFSDANHAGNGRSYTNVIIVEAVVADSSDASDYSPHIRCAQKRKVWVQTGDTEDAGFCSIDGNLYLKCGDDAKDIPEFVPRLASYAVTLLKTAAPIVLIIVSLVYLVKSMTSGKEDEIKKERTNFIKKLIIAAIIYFVVTIVQFIVLKVADSSEKKSLTNCLSCFLNGTGDNNCSNLYYKDNENGDIVCKWLSNNKEFNCEK